MASFSFDQALKLLKDTSWFQDASPGFQTALASIMVPIDAENGHIFVEEGAIIRTFMIVEEGTLVRTKLSADKNSFNQMQNSIRKSSKHHRTATIQMSSVVVDTIAGRGHVTGLIHCIQDGSKAYATVTARGPAKVWLVSGEDFRDIVRSDMQFSWDLIVAMSRELRVGSKSIRKIMTNLRQQASDLEAGAGVKGQTLRVLCYDATSWVLDGFKPAVEAFNKTQGKEKGFCIVMDYTTERLGSRSATFAAGFDAVCLFVNDTADADVMQTLSLLGVKMIAQRAAGFDRIDTKAARAYGITVARVPAYSPYAVAEMAASLLMAVNRKITKASNRVKMANFSLDSGLLGMDIHGKTVGVMGTGKIGQILTNIILGFGANLICYDVFESDAVKEAGGVYVSKDEILERSDVLFLMMPLLPSTHHTINESTLRQLKKGVILINTSRGGLVDTKALLQGLRSGIISGCGLDVYENEGEYFFQDWSARQIKDPYLVELLGLNNVVLTAHQAFFTKEAVNKIVSTTIENLSDYMEGLTGMQHPNNCIPPLSQD